MIPRIIKRVIILGIGTAILLAPLICKAAEPQVRTEQLFALWPHPQATPNNTVRVEPGIISISANAKIEFAGGNSPAFSVVTANSRIDLLVINSSGTLEVIQGTQSATPSAPAYPATKLAIAEVTINETVTVVINYSDIKDVRFFLNLGGGSTISDLSDAEITAVSDKQILVYDGVTDNRFENVTMSGDAVLSNTGALTVANSAITTVKLANTSVTAAKLGSDIAGTGLTGGNGSALAVDAGTIANKIVQLDVNAKLPAVDGSQLTNVLGADSTKLAKAGDTMTGGLTLSPASGNALVTTAGNVGIGTASPGAKLEVVSGADKVAINPSGITYAGAGQPKRTIVLTASGGIGATTSGADAQQIETTTNKVNYYVLDFDATTAEYATWQFSVPDSYTGTTVTAKLYWQANATTGSAVWKIESIGLGDTNAMDSGWGTAVSVTDGASSSANALLVTTETSALTTGWSAGGLGMVRVTRDAANASDTLAVDARLIAVRLEWTASAESD